jgi:hypothetical protein
MIVLGDNQLLALEQVVDQLWIQAMKNSLCHDLHCPQRA